MIKKVRSHISQNEPLMFERSSPGKIGYQLPALDVPAVDAGEALGAANVREEIEDFPEVSEVEVIRHFTRLSTYNYAIDHGLYPLGSCTMKYNPRVNEAVARTEGLAWAHPYQPDELSQGAMEMMAALEAALCRDHRHGRGDAAAGRRRARRADRHSAGAGGARSAGQSRGRRSSFPIRRTAPTRPRPASPAMRSETSGRTSAACSTSKRSLGWSMRTSPRLMVTNPNTLGVFEENIGKVAEILHAKGAMVYMDGANMNALAGITRPGDFGIDVMHLNLHKTFSTPHGGGGPGLRPGGVKQHLEPFLPIPRLDRRHGRLALELRPSAIDRPRSRLLRQLRRAGAGAGLHHGPRRRRASPGDHRRDAERQLHPQGLEGHFELPHKAPVMHECVFSDERQAKRGVRTGDIAKRLIDYGFHPYTVSFPLIVKGALMIEPTETESKQEIDLFIDAHQVNRRRGGNRSGTGEVGPSFDPRQPRRRSNRRTKTDSPLDSLELP